MARGIRVAGPGGAGRVPGMRIPPLLLGIAGTLAAAEPFSRTLTPEDFRAAGLGRLTPAEVARLDALVAGARASPAAAAASAAPSAPPEKPLPPRPAAPTGGDAGEEGVIASRLAGEFRGWEPRMVFALENGQRWQESGGGRYAGPPLASPAVRIRPGVLGSHWMRIEGVRVEVKVRRLDAGR